VWSLCCRKAQCADIKFSTQLAEQYTSLLPRCKKRAPTLSAWPGKLRNVCGTSRKTLSPRSIRWWTPIPLRCRQTEAALINKAIDNDVVANAAGTLAAEVSPIDDVRSTKNYRLQVSLNLLKHFILSAEAAASRE